MGSSASAGGAGGSGAAGFAGGAGDAGFAGSLAATGLELAAGSTQSDFGGGGVFINSDQSVSMTLVFSAGGGSTGLRGGAAAGSLPVHPLDEFKHFVQHSPSGLGSPQTAHNRTADLASAAVDGAAAASDTSSRPQHTQ